MLTSPDNSALVRRKQEVNEAAERLHQRALSKDGKTLEKEDSETLMSIGDLAIALGEQSKYEAAEELHRRALSAGEKSSETENLGTLSSVKNSAPMREKRENHEEAKEYFRRMARAREKSSKTENLGTLSNIKNSALEREKRENYEETKEFFRGAQSNYQEMQGKEHSETLTNVQNLAMVRNSQDECEATEKLFQRAPSSREELMGVERAETRNSVNGLAHSLQKQGKVEVPEKLFQGAQSGREKTQERCNEAFDNRVQKVGQQMQLTQISEEILTHVAAGKRKEEAETDTYYQWETVMLERNPPKPTSKQLHQQRLIWRKRLLFMNIYSNSQRKLVSIWSTALQHFIKVLTALGLLEDSVQIGKKRIHWTCHCGYRSFDDFVELRPGAVDAYDAFLREHTGTNQQSRSPANRTGLFGSLWNLRTTFPFLGKQTANQTYLPRFQMTGVAPNNQTPAFIPSADCLFLLLCIPHKKYATKLVHLDLRTIKSDQQFFCSLKRNYSSMRGIARSLLSLKTLKRVKFVQFEMYKSELVDIRKVDDIPPEDRRDEYQYRPMPADMIPPVGENHMMHLCTHPQDADETQAVCLDRIPKKLKERLLVCPSKGTGVGWGVHFAEGWHYTLFSLLAYVTLIISSLIFLICWAVLKQDLQSASGVAAYMLAFTALCIGSVQAALELN